MIVDKILCCIVYYFKYKFYGLCFWIICIKIKLKDSIYLYIFAKYIKINHINIYKMLLIIVSMGYCYAKS